MAGLKPIKLPAPKQDRYSSIDPLDSRYFDEEISRIFSERSSISYQAYVEAALAKTLSDFNICSSKIANEIESASRKVTPEKVAVEEKITNHNIKALVNSIKIELSDEAKPFVHFGATSYDIIASATSLQMRDGLNQVVIPRLKKLLSTLVNLTEQYADTVQIGRTHGQHGVPITFGFALSEYVSRLGESTRAIEDLSKMFKGKFSGAVGAYNALCIFVDDPLKFEKSLLEKLELEPAEFSSQITPPEAMIRIIDELSITAGIMANLGHDMRHLQRTEISEIREKFEKGQTGSSTMAHKRNPWNFENVASMHRQVLAQSVNANLNISSEHQRDLTDSASSRFYGLVPALVASQAKRLNKVMSKIEVDEEQMSNNLYLTKGAIAAEPLYLLLEKYGHIKAHEKAKVLAHQALIKDKTLFETLKNDPKMRNYLDRFTAAEISIIQSPELNYTGLSAKKARQIARKWRKFASAGSVK